MLLLYILPVSINFYGAFGIAYIYFSSFKPDGTFVFPIATGFTISCHKLLRIRVHEDCPQSGVDRDLFCLYNSWEGFLLMFCEPLMMFNCVSLNSLIKSNPPVHFLTQHNWRKKTTLPSMLIQPFPGFFHKEKLKDLFVIFWMVGEHQMAICF